MKHIAVQRPTSTAGALRWGVYLVGGLLGCAVLAVLGGPLLGWAIQQIPRLLIIGVAALGLYLVPGLAVLRLLWHDASLTRPERLALAAAISVGLPPLLLEWAQVVRLPWTVWTTYSYLALAFGVWLWPARWAVWEPGHSLHQIAQRFRPTAHSLILVSLVAWGLLMRLYVVRNLPVGMWGDSYQHTMMAQLLVDNHGVFQSWEPYAPLTTFTYHYGFHANVALFHWLTGISVAQSVLVVGQIMNALTILLAYLLTVRWSGSRWAGIWAAVLTGFVNLQPLFYVNWGRYTQLAGQVVLPGLLVCVQAALEQPKLNRRSLVLAALVGACLMLTHYLVTIFAALFVGAYLVMLAVRTPQPKLWWRLVVGAGAIGVLAVLLALPQLINSVQGQLVRNAQGFVSGDVGAQRIAAAAAFESLTPRFVNRPILLLAGIGTLLALARRHWHVGLLVTWTLLLLLAVVPQLLDLRGTGVIQFFTAAIAFYLTLVPLAAYPLGIASEMLLGRWSCWSRLVIGGALVAIVVWSARWQPQVIDHNFQLFTPADERAMQWIKTNTLLDAKFLVNMFPAFGNNLFVGDDGGWWLPLLTRRRSTLPPLTYGSERGPTDDYAKQINDFAWALHKTPLPSAEGVALCRAAGITYVYSGPHVDGSKENQMYRVDIAALRRDPVHFQTVYDHDGVVIFRLVDAP